LTVYNRPGNVLQEPWNKKESWNVNLIGPEKKLKTNLSNQKNTKWIGGEKR